ncbi:MAG TPA: hypothetical protein VF598_05035, partial [Hymenobacter sp.]
MIRRLRLCFPFAGLLVSALLFLSYEARAQVKPKGRGEGLPPSTRRCRYVRLTPGRDTTDFTLSDTLTVVPSSVAANGQAVAYNLRTDQYRWVRPAPRDSSGTPLPDSLLLCYRVLPLRLSAARYRRPLGLMDTLGFRQGVMRMEDFSV